MSKDFNAAEGRAFDTDSWTGPHADDPETQTSPHGLECCLATHDSEWTVTELTHEQVTVTVSCPKCQERVIWYTREGPK